MKSPRDVVTTVTRRVLSPFISDRKRLPFLYWLCLLNGASIHQPELTQLEKFFGDTRIAIDVGANRGLFTYRLSKVFRHVYSFEINPDVAAPITQYNAGNITLFPCGLSSESRTSKFYVPVVDGRVLDGWGSMDRGHLPGAQSFIERDFPVRPLDDFGFTEIDFIKIDVEGHELEVLIGGTSTIEKSRPVLLIEVQGENLPAVNSWFSSKEFVQISLTRIFSLKEENPNYVFVPAEKLSQLAIRIE